MNKSIGISGFVATKYCSALVFAFVMMAPSAFAERVTFDWVTVGDPDNVGDSTRGGLGGVSYEYRISKYEVTNNQYANFLNATSKGGLDLGYSPLMDGIERSGSGTETDRYVYSASIGRDQQPVNYIAFRWAQLFVNWLENGQPDEAGSEAILSGVYAALSGPRSPGATYFLPSDDEWTKAAFYNPETESYFKYATGSDEVPYSAMPPGNAAPDPSNTANVVLDDGIANGYNDGFAATGRVDFPFDGNFLTDVGAFPLAASPYGTFDQNGNVWEWTEGGGTGASRAYFGGGWGTQLGEGVGGAVYGAISGDSQTGIRIASRVIVPEPHAGALLLTGFLAFFLVSIQRRGLVTARRL